MKHVLATLMLVGIVRSAAAHPLDIGYLRINSAGNTVSVALDLDAKVAAKIGTELTNAPITTDAGTCAWRSTASMTGEAECPTGASTLRWELPFIEKLPATFQLLVNVHGFAGERVAIVDQHSPVLELNGISFERGFGELVRSGAAHIGAAPEEWKKDGELQLPAGIDHILFLLALLLAGGTVFQLVGIASGFTLGHSVTLALAALDVLRPPPWLIEPLIALTIAAAALEAFTGKLGRHRWKIATAFGLIHGFAFASALTHIDLSGARMVKSLFGYNLGVELGQVVFVVLFATPIIWLHKRPNVAKPVIKSAASLIFVAGIYWFIVRLATSWAPG